MEDKLTTKILYLGLKHPGYCVIFFNVCVLCALKKKPNSLSPHYALPASHLFSGRVGASVPINQWGSKVPVIVSSRDPSEYDDMTVFTVCECLCSACYLFGHS